MNRILLVFGTVVLTIASALVVDYAADHSEALFIVVSLLVLAFLINIIKFLLWGVIHKKYFLSRSYLLTALFFPMIYLVSLFKGEALVSTAKIVGLMVIMLGIILTEYEKK